MELVIQPAEIRDAAAIADIYAPYVLETPISFETKPPTPEAMARRMAAILETHPWLIAETAGETVGYAYAGTHRERSAYRWSVDVTAYVRRGRSRCGIGRALYGPLLEVLRGQGFRSAFAGIALPNPGSVGLHEAVGFEYLGAYRDVGFKLGRWHDVGYWRRGLSEGTTPPADVIPFATFRAMASFAAALPQR